MTRIVAFVAIRLAFGRVEIVHMTPLRRVTQAMQRGGRLRHPPSPLPWEIAGGVAVLALVMAGGALAGRSRSRAKAVARASAGT